MLLCQPLVLDSKFRVKKYCSVFNYYIKYVNNSIHKPYNLSIPQCEKRVHENNELTCYLYLSIKKGLEYREEHWRTRKKCS